MLQMKGHPHSLKKLLKLKAHITPHTIIVGDFNTPLSSMEKETKQRHSETQWKL
jgi:endonuclease/exonuclease/phosphatase family metal-dependent hydrolase